MLATERRKRHDLYKRGFMKKFVVAALAAQVIAASSGAFAQTSDFPAAVISDVRGAVLDTETMETLKRKRGPKKGVKEELENLSLRVAAVRQEALRVGAQSGLAKRYEAITTYLDANENRLNVLYNFAPFVDGKILLPAVSKNQDTFTLDAEDGTATMVRTSYTISQEAQIISSPPTWRDYLYQEFEMPEESHSSVLPVGPKEIKVWEEGIVEGWKAGITMADEVFSDRLADLTKNIEERYRYQLLLNQGVVTAPVAGVDRRSITYDGRTINVGETVYSVEQPVNYTASPEWKPVWTR